MRGVLRPRIKVAPCGVRECVRELVVRREQVLLQALKARARQQAEWARGQLRHFTASAHVVMVQEVEPDATWRGNKGTPSRPCVRDALRSMRGSFQRRGGISLQDGCGTEVERHVRLRFIAL